MPDAHPENAAEVEPKIGFYVRQHYLKDLSVENPWGPISAAEVSQLKLDLDGRVQVRSKETDGSGESDPGDGTGRYDVVECTLSLTASRDANVMLLCEITYAAEVSFENVPEPVQPQILSTSVPHFMLPLINRVLDLGVRAAGYPGLTLPEVDFLAAFNRAGGQEASLREFKNSGGAD